MLPLFGSPQKRWLDFRLFATDILCMLLRCFIYIVTAGIRVSKAPEYILTLGLKMCQKYTNKQKRKQINSRHEKPKQKKKNKTLQLNPF